MDTNDNSNNSEGRKIGFFKVFSHIDTQSAIVVALVISFGSFFVKYFIEVCSFVYWRCCSLLYRPLFPVQVYS